MSFLKKLNKTSRPGSPVSPRETSPPESPKLQASSANLPAMSPKEQTGSFREPCLNRPPGNLDKGSKSKARLVNATGQPLTPSIDIIDGKDVIFDTTVSLDKLSMGSRDGFTAYRYIFNRYVNLPAQEIYDSPKYIVIFTKTVAEWINRNNMNNPVIGLEKDWENLFCYCENGDLIFF